MSNRWWILFILTNIFHVERLRSLAVSGGGGTNLFPLLLIGGRPLITHLAPLPVWTRTINHLVPIFAERQSSFPQIQRTQTINQSLNRINLIKYRNYRLFMTQPSSKRSSVCNWFVTFNHHPPPLFSVSSCFVWNYIFCWSILYFCSTFDCFSSFSFISFSSFFKIVFLPSVIHVGLTFQLMRTR